MNGPRPRTIAATYEAGRAGLKEFNVKDEKERIRRYRRYVYEAGALNRPEKGKAIDRILEKERKQAGV